MALQGLDGVLIAQWLRATAFFGHKCRPLVRGLFTAGTEGAFALAPGAAGACPARSLLDAALAYSQLGGEAFSIGDTAAAPASAST